MSGPWPPPSDQCAEVGFEMLILTFGSGFDSRTRGPGPWPSRRGTPPFARGKGLEIGSYSLLASRSVGGGNDVLMPPGQTPTFGNSPCLGSAWGAAYFRRLYEFHRESGFTLLEHDGSYPGDLCRSEAHPGHRASPTRAGPSGGRSPPSTGGAAGRAST